MVKSRSPTDADIQRWIDRGLGQGSGENYQPFFYVRDVPSHGRSAIVQGLKVRRNHHYLSDIEYAYHVLAEFSENVLEIREQFALLSRDETSDIAEQLGVRHPRCSSTNALLVQTSDLVLTVEKDSAQSLEVLCCKAASAIDPSLPGSARTLEKIHIERLYWQRRNVKWTLVTDRMIPKNRFQNLDFFRPAMFARELDELIKMGPELLGLIHHYWTPDRTFNQLLKELSKELSIEVEQCFCLIGRAVWTKLLRFNLDSMQVAHNALLPPLLKPNQKMK